MKTLSLAVLAVTLSGCGRQCNHEEIERRQLERERRHLERLHGATIIDIERFKDLTAGRGGLRCFHCLKPADWLDMFEVATSPSTGTAILCKDCWPKLTLKQRLDYHAEHSAMWRSSPESAAALQEAVKRASQ